MSEIAEQFHSFSFYKAVFLQVYGNARLRREMQLRHAYFTTNLRPLCT